MKIGDTRAFVPTEFSELSKDGRKRRFRHQGKVTGTIIAINWTHRHFTLEFVVNGNTLHETFKFEQ